MWDVIASGTGAIIGGIMNNMAAEKAAKASIEGAQIQAQSIREGREAAERELARAREENAPGQSYLRQVVAGPGDLTPAQRMQLDELRRVTGNQIRTSSIAGSGRTAASLLRRTESEFTNDALERNRTRAYDAASGMAGRVAQASTGIAGLNASMIPQAGKVMGDATTAGGLYDAQSGLASGKLYSSTLGDIGALIAKESKPKPGKYNSKFYSAGNPPGYEGDEP
ncbi:MAG: hypothetical protein IT537_03155 [Hyphomicrobiales bacterium]|nr:hypothetical protein [Hyphomicrobiales bacterium]